jgi:hypothetical protein
MIRETALAARASRIGGHAFRYLNEELHNGRVVSAFRNGVNVLLEEQAAPTYIAVQTPDVPLHPWALEATLAHQIPAGDSAVAAIRQIRFGGGVTVDFASTPVCDLTILPLPAEWAVERGERLAVVRRIVERSRRRLASDPFHPRVERILREWRSGSDSTLLMRLVGLGTGSTPGGDDVLVGLLAGLTALSKTSPVALWALAELRGGRLSRTCLSQCTQPASGQMVAAAADGSFPEPLRDLIHDIPTAEPTDLSTDVERLLAVGATSGLFMLEGLITAMTLAA